MSVTFCGQALTFKEDAVWGSSGGGTGWRVWDASLVALRLTEGALPLPSMVSATRRRLVVFGAAISALP